MNKTKPRLKTAILRPIRLAMRNYCKAWASKPRGTFLVCLFGRRNKKRSTRKRIKRCASYTKNACYVKSYSTSKCRQRKREGRRSRTTMDI